MSISSFYAHRVTTIILGAALGWAAAASADTINVTRFDDPPVDGCDLADCSLREAIDAASVTGGDDDIMLQAGTYRLEISGVEDNNFGGDLDIGFFTGVHIIAPASGAVVDAEGADRAFHVQNGGGLELVRVTVTGVSNSLGGAVRVESGGTGFLVDSTISGNTALVGAGVVNLGTLTVYGSTLRDNIALGAVGIPAWGGAIRNEGTLDIVNSTISGNQALSTYGGLGAGIFNLASVTLKNVTFANNSGPSGGNPVDIAQLPNGGSTTLQNTLIDNFAGGGSVSCGGGTFISLGNNLVDRPGCGAGGGDIVGTTALGPLADNGGPTATHKLLEGSDAIDNGADLSGEGITADQRGVARPQRSAWDIGAYEAEPLSGAPIVVNITTDGLDVLPGDGICEITTGVGDCSYRAAVGEARVSGIENISVPAGTYTFSIAANILFLSGELTITGAGSSQTIIDANLLTSILFSSATVNLIGLTATRAGVTACLFNSGTMTLSDVQLLDCQGATSLEGTAIWNGTGSLIANNLVVTGADATAQAAIFNDGGFLSLTDAQVSNNQMTGLVNVAGGTMELLRVDVSNNPNVGIRNRAGQLTITDSTINSNVGLQDGGGIDSDGPVDILRTTINNNSAEDGGAGIKSTVSLTITDSEIRGNVMTSQGVGGGIAASGDSLTVIRTTVADNTSFSGGGISSTTTSTLIADSTVSGNTATSGAGGINAGVGTVTLDNVTISGNNGTTFGGGLSSGVAVLNNVTVVGNAANQGAGILSCCTGVTLSNVILADNLAFGVQDSNCGGTPYISQGYNMSSDATCGFSALGDQNEVDPLLGPLAANGGLTKTHQLMAESPAVDAGNPDPPALDNPRAAGATTACEPTDQRGVLRPFDGDGDETATCDIGAFEYDGDPLVFVSGFEDGTLGDWAAVVP